MYNVPETIPRHSRRIDARLHAELDDIKGRRLPATKLIKAASVASIIVASSDQPSLHLNTACDGTRRTDSAVNDRAARADRRVVEKWPSDARQLFISTPAGVSQSGLINCVPCWTSYNTTRDRTSSLENANIYRAFLSNKCTFIESLWATFS